MSAVVSALSARVIGSAFFAPDVPGEPMPVVALTFFSSFDDAPSEIVQIDPDFFDQPEVSVRLWRVENTELIRIQSWGEMTAQNFAESGVLLLVRPEDGDGLYAHGSLLSVVGGTPTVAGGGEVASRSPEGRRV